MFSETASAYLLLDTLLFQIDKLFLWSLLHNNTVHLVISIK